MLKEMEKLNFKIENLIIYKIKCMCLIGKNKNVIKKIKKIFKNKKNNKKQMKKQMKKKIKENKCPICLVKLKKEKRIMEVQICGHLYCYVCFIGLLKMYNNCPLCRGNVIGKNTKSYIEYNIWNGVTYKRIT
jgi:hypothetical protein